MNILQVKKQFGIIGNDSQLDEAINVALQVSPTDISVLIIGESGTGKESIPKLIHQNSHRKHNAYIAVNCGAIPEGTIDSELFGHEKGSFTGAHEKRKGYFEAANDGTIFLDEVGELPLSTQARLLRVLENGEFIKVGASKPLTTNVRIIAATNVNMIEAVKKGEFREDLFYRLNTVSIQMPPLRNRGKDIHLLFRKFSSDFAENYKTPPVKLTEEAVLALQNYNWPGNIRQLKNFVTQLSVTEKERLINKEVLEDLLPKNLTKTPILFKKDNKEDISERDILYKVLFDMKRELNELKAITEDLIKGKNKLDIIEADNSHVLEENDLILSDQKSIESQETLSLFDQEKILIEKCLKKHKGNRKNASSELGISERTLYRKLKEFGI
ncbi:MAG: sigma-54-dependent Fis family transcriptional regulator [Flavobacteriales bacterium]|nr:sigma-54-dependent Fis family transcriptional regulator [Flavobacteriales bacterium]